MISLSLIESDIVTAIKAKDQLAADTLRGLKTRIQNQKISLMKDLSENDLVLLVKSEVKRRKEAAQTYIQGQRQELADKELVEAVILEKYLPEQMSNEELSALVEKVIAENSFAQKDFGAAMGKLKAQVGNMADGGALAKILKEKLK
jgi:uncharacterized protein